MFENESKFCQNLKFIMTTVISEISDFHHFLNNLKSYWFVKFESQNGILDSYLIVLNDF